jgi:hypothetical protein
MAIPLNPKQFKAAFNASAPLAKGVQGRTEALMNMAPHARFAAEAKTAVRALRTQKGRPHANVVHRYSEAVTGNTKKQRRFGRA